MLGTLTITVGQREPTAVSQKEEPTESLMNMPQGESAGVGDELKDDQEIIEELPILEEKLEQVEPNGDAQSNEVGFKKVFKFVGFKFTMKKEKTEKSEPVQLLTVKKDEVEANGTDKPEVKLDAAEEKLETVDRDTPASLEVGKPNEEVVHLVEKTDEETLAREDCSVESPPEKEEENPDQAESKDEVEGEKEPKKSPESPTNQLVSETSSPLKKFFTQGWAGLRKKTSFKKPKEGEQQENDPSEAPVESNDKVKPSEEETLEAVETSKPESGVSLDETSHVLVVETEQTEDASLAEVSTKLKSDEGEESNVLIDEKDVKSPDGNLKLTEECPVSLGENASFSLDEKLQHAVCTETLKEKEAETDVGSAEKVDDLLPEVKHSPGLSSSEQSSDVVDLKEVDLKNELSEAHEAPEMVQGDGEQNIEQSPQDESMQKPSEGIASEVELLASQEKAKLQGSPLRKLFTGSGLKKLSGKKPKVKKEEELKPEEMTEQVQASSEYPEAPAPEVEKGDSIPSSPDELVDASTLEKPISDETQVAENEGEGATSDGEKKKDGITPWASFKKLVTPKKRVKRLSESDKEDEPEKAGKSATMSSTDSANSENHEETKGNEDEPKVEKSTEENKRKVDSSVSWEALICVGSSKKRARKSSDSDEEETQKPLEENQKPEDETGKSKESETEAPLASSQETDQAQGSPSPEQAGSPSEGEGVSTWASFKRLVTPRRKSKTRMEDKAEESVAVSSTENQTSDGEPGKDESWVSFKKLIPGRKKKKSDGKLEHAPVEEGQETAEDEDDVPAVVPLSEYEAAEQEKLEAQQAIEAEAIRKETVAQTSAAVDLLQAQEPSEGLVHAVTVTVVEGERAVTTIEERSPSWISATVAESVQQEEACQEVQQTKQVFKTDLVLEPAVVIKTFGFSTSEISSHTTVNEVELTSEAVTALEETVEVSCAEETTEMISAVSQLSESQVTTEESTPVPEAESSEQSLEEQKKQTQEVLEEVAEKVRLSEVAKMVTSTTVIEVITCSSQTKESEVRDEVEEVIVTAQDSVLVKGSLKEMEPEETEIEQVERIQGMQEFEEMVCGKVTSVETCFASQECIQLEKSCVVNGEDAQQDKGTQDGRERETVEEPEKVLQKLESEGVLYSCGPGSAVSEPEVHAEEIIIAQQQYQNNSTQQEILSLYKIEDSHYTDSVPAVDTESVVVLRERVLEVDQVADCSIGLESTFTSPVEFTGIAQESAHAGQVDDTEIPLEEGQPLREVEELESKKQLEQKDIVCSKREELLQPEQTLPGSKTQKASDMLKCENTRVEPGAESMETWEDSEQTKETKPEIETLLAEEKLPLDHHQAGELETKLKPEQFIEKTEVEKNQLESVKSDLCDDQSAHLNQVLEENLPLQEEITISDIPKVEASGAQKVAGPITAAAVEEQVVAESVSLLQMCTETLEPIDVTVAEDVAGISSDIPAVECEVEEHIMESVSQTAAAIIDAAFEAATSGVADGSLGRSAESDGEEAPGHAKSKDMPQEQSRTQLEIEKCEVIQSVTIESQSSTLVQDIIQTSVQELKQIVEASEVHCEVDTAQIPVDKCEVQDTEYDLHSEQTTVNLEQGISLSNTVEHTDLEKPLLEAVEHPEDEITVSEVSQEVKIDSIAQGPKEQVAAALEEKESVSQCEPESSQICPSAQELNDLDIEIHHHELSHTVSMESHSSAMVQAISQSAVEEMERGEKVEHEATASHVFQCVLETVQNPEDVCVFAVRETTEMTATEQIPLHAEIEQDEASHTVSMESHSSTIVQTIIQTAGQEVKRGEEVAHEAAPEVLQRLVEMAQNHEDVHVFEVQEMAETVAKVHQHLHSEIEQGEASYIEYIESHTSTIVQTIIQTAVEEVERVDKRSAPNAASEDQCEAETDRSPEDGGLYEVQGIAETGQVTHTAEAKVQYELEIAQTTKVGVCDVEDKKGSDQQSSIKTATDEQPSSVEEIVIENVSERQASVGQMDKITLSEVCKEEVNTISILGEMEPAAFALPDQECSEQLNEPVSQEMASQAKDLCMTETKEAKDLLLQGGGSEQQPEPEVETQVQDVESENTSGLGPVIETSALEALSQECLEAAEQLKHAKAEQTVESKELQVVQTMQVDKEEVVQSQKGNEVEAPTDTHGPEHAHHEHPQAKAVSQES